MAVPSHTAPSRQRVRVTVVAVISGLIVGLAAGGCSSGVDQQSDSAPTTTIEATTTTGSGDSAPTSPDMAPTSAPLAAGEIVARLTAAQTARDLCAFLAAMQAAQPNPSDRAGVLAVYAALDSSVASMKSSVPAELTGSWTDLESATTDGLAALRRARGDLGDPEFRAAFRRTSSVRAATLIERYERMNCR